MKGAIFWKNWVSTTEKRNTGEVDYATSRKDRVPGSEHRTTDQIHCQNWIVQLHLCRDPVSGYSDTSLERKGALGNQEHLYARLDSYYRTQLACTHAELELSPLFPHQGTQVRRLSPGLRIQASELYSERRGTPTEQPAVPLEGRGSI